MKRRAAQAPPARIRAVFAESAGARPGRLDFLFDERRKRELPAPPASAATGARPWDLPPPPRPRRDGEAFIEAGIGFAEERIAVGLAVPLAPVRAILEAAAIFFHGVIARLFRYR